MVSRDRCGDNMDNSLRAYCVGPLDRALLRVILHFLGHRDRDRRLVECQCCRPWRATRSTHFLGPTIDELVTDPKLTLMLDVGTEMPASVEPVVRGISHGGT